MAPPGNYAMDGEWQSDEDQGCRNRDDGDEPALYFEHVVVGSLRCLQASISDTKESSWLFIGVVALDNIPKSEE
jgi:hypothetical protein